MGHLLSKTRLSRAPPHSRNNIYLPRNETQQLDLSPISNSPESRLKYTLLSTNPHIVVVAAVGLTGTGKTTILRALARDLHVSARFSHGCCFIHIGRLLSRDSLVQHLRYLLQNTSAHHDDSPFQRLFNPDAHPPTDQQVAATFVHQLIGFNILVIFDDIWDTNPNTFALIELLFTEAQAQSQGTFRFLTSTRSKRVSNNPMCDVAIDTNPHPRTYNGQTERLILLRHANMQPEQLNDLTDENRHAFESVLRGVGGIRHSLAVAGTCVRQGIECTESGDPMSSWMHVAHVLQNSVSQLGFRSTADHPGLHESISETVADLHRMWHRQFPLQNPRLAEIFRSFCAMPRHGSITKHTLAKLWSFALSDVDKVVRAFSDVNLLMEHDGVITMHDTVHCYAIYLSISKNEEPIWHGRLLESNGFKLSHFDAKPSGDPWWLKAFPSGSYIRDHAIFHVVGYGRVHDAGAIVSDFRWGELMNRLDDTVRMPYERFIYDLRVLKDYLCSDNRIPYLKERLLLEGVEMVLKVLEECRSLLISEWLVGLFWIYERLVRQGAKLEFVRVFTQSMETCIREGFGKQMSYVNVRRGGGGRGVFGATRRLELGF